jgi:hypothetical protein
MYLYVFINFAKRPLFMWDTCPQSLRQISVTDKNMCLCKKQCFSHYTVKGLKWNNFFIRIENNT